MAKRSNGEGSISQRPDGRWQAALRVNGVRRTVYGRTKAEAQRRLAALRGEAVATGALASPGARTVGDLLDAWLATITPNLKPATLAQYRLETEKHIRPALGAVKLAQVNPARLQRLYAQLQEAGHRRTAALVYALTRQTFAFAVLWRWLPENPCERVQRPSHRAARKEMWGADQLATFLEATAGDWLGPLWLLAVATGARLGELLGLAWADVDTARGALAIRQTLQRVGGAWLTASPKTRAGERVISLPSEATAALERQRAQQGLWRLQSGTWSERGLVFTTEQGEPIHRATVAHAMRRACDRLGLPRLTPHGLRHLHASLLLAQGLPLPAVSARLGHAHTGITAGVYAHMIGKDDSAAARAMERILR